MDLPPHFHTSVIHLRKIKWLPVSQKVESCIAVAVFKYWNGIVLSYINDMFKPLFKRYDSRSQKTLDIPL